MIDSIEIEPNHEALDRERDALLDRLFETSLGLPEPSDTEIDEALANLKAKLAKEA